MNARRKIGFWVAVGGVSYITPAVVKALIHKFGAKWPGLVHFDNYVHGTGGA